MGFLDSDPAVLSFEYNHTPRGKTAAVECVIVGMRRPRPGGGWAGGALVFTWKPVKSPGELSVYSGAWFLFAIPAVDDLLKRLSSQPMRAEGMCQWLRARGFQEVVR